MELQQQKLLLAQKTANLDQFVKDNSQKTLLLEEKSSKLKEIEMNKAMLEEGFLVFFCASKTKNY